MPSPSLCDDSFFSSTLLGESDMTEMPVLPESLALFASSRLPLDVSSSIPALFALTSLPIATLLSER
jgi:hypothetical protein